MVRRTCHCLVHVVFRGVFRAPQPPGDLATRIMASQLPTELWQPVFSAVMQSTLCIHGYSPAHDLRHCPIGQCSALRDVFGLSTTCRFLWTIGQTFLYQTVQHNADSKSRASSSCQLAAACKRSGIWPHIRGFKLSATGRRIQSVFTSAPLSFIFANLITLELRLQRIKFTPAIVAALLAAQNIQHLTLFGMVEGWDFAIPRNWALSGFAPNLESLVYALQDMNLPPGEVRVENLQFFKPPSIKTIDLRQADQGLLSSLLAGLEGDYLTFSQVESLYVNQDMAGGQITRWEDENARSRAGIPELRSILLRCFNLCTLHISMPPVYYWDHMPIASLPKLEFVSVRRDTDALDLLKALRRASQSDVLIKGLHISSSAYPLPRWPRWSSFRIVRSNVPHPSIGHILCGRARAG